MYMCMYMYMKMYIIIIIIILNNLLFFAYKVFFYDFFSTKER